MNDINHDTGKSTSGESQTLFSSYGVLFSVCVPDSVRELFDGCFKGCSSLRRVTFGPSSSLERIGVGWILGTSVEEVSMPDGVHELRGGSFDECKSLRRLSGLGFGLFRGALRVCVTLSQQSK